MNKRDLNRHGAHDRTLENLVHRVELLRTVIEALVDKVESNEIGLNPEENDFLDSFNVIGSELGSLKKLMSTAGFVDYLRSLLVLPVVMSQDTDPALVKITQGRVAAFDHNVVPLLLRTRLDPEAELRKRVAEREMSKSAFGNTKREMEIKVEEFNDLLLRISAKIDGDEEEEEDDSETLKEKMTTKRKISPKQSLNEAGRPSSSGPGYDEADDDSSSTDYEEEGTGMDWEELDRKRSKTLDSAGQAKENSNIYYFLNYGKTFEELEEEKKVKKASLVKAAAEGAAVKTGPPPPVIKFNLVSKSRQKD